MIQDKVTSDSLPLLGFTVKLPDKPEEEEVTNVFQLYQKKALYYSYREENNTAQRLEKRHIITPWKSTLRILFEFL